MRASVEVRPGEWRTMTGEPDALLRRAHHAQGGVHRDRGKLLTLARTFRYAHDPGEKWQHPEAMVRRARLEGVVFGDCEDWALAHARYAGGRPDVKMLGPRKGHARSAVSGHYVDVSGLSQIARAGLRKLTDRARRYAKKAYNSIRKVDPELAALVAGHPEVALLLRVLYE